MHGTIPFMPVQRRCMPSSHNCAQEFLMKIFRIGSPSFLSIAREAKRNEGDIKGYDRVLHKNYYIKAKNKSPCVEHKNNSQAPELYQFVSPSDCNVI